MAEPDEERVQLSFADGIAVMTLVRQARMNAIDEAMHEGLRDALTRLEGEAGLRVVILTGTGRAFSTGQDLGERAAAFQRGEQPDLSASLGSNYNPLVRRLAALPVPVIAAVNGLAFGAGAALAIACDIVLAAETARFQFGFINVGLGPDSGASWHLPRLIGQARALDLALTGRPVSAHEAVAMGMISRVVAEDELSPAAQAIATDLASRSPEALASIKRQLRLNPDGSLDAALETERGAQAELGRTDAYREAVLRFARARK